MEMPDNEMKAGMRLEDAGGRVTSGMHESGAHPAREGTASDSEGGGATHEHGLDWRGDPSNWLCGVGMAAFGLLNPLLAAFIHVSSELVFILNSARLVPSVTLAKAFGGQSPLAVSPPVSAAKTA
jgi:hypothetical protein